MQSPDAATPADIGILAVDLDGTLLQSDMLFESFWSALGQSWKAPFLAARALSEGRAQLKRYLAGAAEIDPATLPYNQGVLDYVRTWRAQGGRTALVTATDERLAKAIAEHLDIFDEVHGSDGIRNLKGANKAAFLKERFGEAGFAYAGDAAADLPVWQAAQKSITVNIPDSLRAQVDQMPGAAEHLTTQEPSTKPYIKALRPHQWLKNVLVFLPMLVGHQLDVGTFFASLMAFIAFSMVASSVYVLNDLLDLKSDRLHPRKCKRPFASGSVPIQHGSLLAIGLLGLGILISALIGGNFLLVMLVYYLLTTAYSLTLKKRFVMDICVLAGLYTIRIVAGIAATGQTLSIWLLAFSIFFFLSLAAVKRLAELDDSARRGLLKPAGRGYHVEDLSMMPIIATSAGYVSVLVMSLYVNSPEVRALYTAPEMLWGVSAVLLYWITRTVMIAHRGQMEDDPVVFAARDRTSHICAVVIFGFAFAGAVW